MLTVNSSYFTFCNSWLILYTSVKFFFFFKEFSLSEVILSTFLTRTFRLHDLYSYSLPSFVFLFYFSEWGKKLQMYVRENGKTGLTHVRLCFHTHDKGNRDHPLCSIRSGPGVPFLGVELGWGIRVILWYGQRRGTKKKFSKNIDEPSDGRSRVFLNNTVIIWESMGEVQTHRSSRSCRFTLKLTFPGNVEKSHWYYFPFGRKLYAIIWP